MIRYFARTMGAHFRSGRALYVLTLFGVALGVASVVSIQLINRTALAAFSGTIQAVSGDADITVLPAAATFPEEQLTTILGTSGVRRARPLLRVPVTLAGAPSVTLEVVGVDLYTPDPLPFRDSIVDASSVLTTPGWIAVTPQLATDQAWSVGDTVRVTYGDVSSQLTIGALIDFQRANALATRYLAVMDIAQAQSRFGEIGVLHQVDIRIAPGRAVEDVMSDLTSRLGTQTRVTTPRGRRDEAEGILRAFRLNLTALSFISLFVGLFLVYTATQAALVRRRREFGVLRSLGASRGQVAGLILAEVAILGVFGVLVGLAGGYGIAVLNIDTVSGTLTNLYLLTAVETVTLPPWTVAVAAAIGLGGASLAAVAPAWDMSRRDPNALLAAFTLHERAATGAPKLFAAGVSLWVLTAVWYIIAGRDVRPAGFVLAVGLLLGLPLITPFVVRGAARRVRVRRLDWRYSLKTLGIRLQAAAVAVSALAVAVAMLVGITLMVGNFRRTLDVWMAMTVQADIYVTTESWQGHHAGASLDSTIVSEFGSVQGVRRVDRLRRYTAYVGDRPMAVIGVDVPLPADDHRFVLLEGTAPDVMQRVLDGAVVISEPLARKEDAWSGDSLRIRTPSGAIAFPVAGVYYDYGTEAGVAAFDNATLERYWGRGEFNSVALYTAEGVDADRVMADIRDRYADVPLLVRSNRRLRKNALSVFDQTFAVTRLLEVMSLLVAATGVTLGLLVLARERVSELALYRSLGATRSQIFRVFLGQGFAMSLLGLLLGGSAGVVLAAILIYVINRAYFGWTIQVFFPGPSLAVQVAAILTAAALASLYPALRASRIPATELSREDV